MKTLLILFLFITLNINAQNPTQKAFVPAPILTNCQRYEKDFEIKNWNGVIQDSIKLNKIKLDNYESLRDKIIDKEVLDTETQLPVILYSIDKALIKKQ